MQSITRSDDTDESLPRRPPRGRRAKAMLVIALTAAAFLLYSRGWSTQRLDLPDGRTYDVLNWDRHTSITIESDGRRTSEEYFWVRYYTNSRDFEAMRTDARALAPALTRFADTLGLKKMKVEATHPLLWRHFPIVVYSAWIRLVRD